MGEIPRYPPFHEGLPAATPQQLLATQDRLIRQIRHEIALSQKDYDRMIPPLLESFAAFVHLTPASKSHHHRGAGGMLRHGLEVALIATRKFHARIIDGHETGERRKVLEPRWRLAVFVAGLTHDIGKSAYDLSVTDIDGRKTWDVYTQSLYEFLCENKLDRYYVGWRKNREHKVHEKFSHLLTMRVVPSAVFSWLNEGDPKIISAIHETISGARPKGSARVMYDLVMEADQLSVSQDIKGQRVADGDESLAVPVPKYLLDAIARLIDSDKWKPNKPGQPLWVTNKGVFIDWKKAVPDIVRLLDRDGARGIPKSKNSIAESLADYDVIKTHNTEAGDESYYVIIAPDALEKGGTLERITAVEINGLEILFDGPHPTPVPAYVGEIAIAAREEAIAQEKAKAKGERKKENVIFREKMVEKGVELPVIAEDDNDQIERAPETSSVERHSDNRAADSDTNAIAEKTEESSEKEGIATIVQKTVRTITAESTQNSSSSSEPVDDSWLDNYGEMGNILRDCFIPDANSKAFMHNGNLLLPYPDGMDRYGDAKGHKLSQIQSLLYFDPMNPNKAVHKLSVNGRKLSVLMIKGDLAQALYALATQEAPDDLVLPDETSRKSPTKVRVKPKSEPNPPAHQADNEGARIEEVAKPSEHPSSDTNTAKPGKRRSPLKTKPVKKVSNSSSKKTPARKKVAKDTPPSMASKNRTAPAINAGEAAITQLFQKYNEIQPAIETVADDAGVWANQIQLIEWFKTDGQSSLSHSALMLGLMRSAPSVKDINKETFVFIPFERDHQNVEP